MTLSAFLDSSPTAFHGAQTLLSQLQEAGFLLLKEHDAWDLQPGEKYCVARRDRGVAAFVVGQQVPWEGGFHLAGAHLDSPAWKAKVEALQPHHGTWKLPVEAYGGPIYRTWLDRDLELAGQVCFRHKGEVQTQLWRSGPGFALIPSLAIHLDRGVNGGAELNPQDHMNALLSIPVEDENTNPILQKLCDDLALQEPDILGTELYLIPSEKAQIQGDSQERILSGRLDDLAMAHALVQGLVQSKDSPQKTSMALWFDAEEIGSRTDTGALSPFMDEMMERLVLSAGGGREELLRSRRHSLLLSCDMAHAVHPNYEGKHDPRYVPTLGKGPVIKAHAQRKYATDGVSEAIIKNIAMNAEVQLQKILSRSDAPCGSTIGPLSQSLTGVVTVDMGNPIWGMHSARETASLQDQEAMIRLLSHYWS